MTNSVLIIIVAFLLGLLCCWLLVSILGMGHRSIRVLRERYKKLDEGFSDLERNFQSQDEANRVERQSLLNKLVEKDESIKTITQSKDELIMDAHSAQQTFNERLQDLENEVRGVNHSKNELQLEYDKLSIEFQRMKDEVEMAKSRGEVAQSSDAEMKMLQHSMLRLREMMEEEGVAYREQIADLSQRLEEALHNKPRKDKLTDISGIGPKIESILNENGILSFADLAGASSQVLDVVRDQLGGLADRIERDDWLGQAAELNSTPIK